MDYEPVILFNNSALKNFFLKKRRAKKSNQKERQAAKVNLCLS